MTDRPEDVRDPPGVPGAEAHDAQFAPPLLHRRGLRARDDGRGDPRPDADRPLVPRPDPDARRGGGGARRAAAPDDGTILRGGEAARASPTATSAASGTSPRRRSAARRYEAGIVPVYKLVDTCAAEFEAYTPYYYSTYETRGRDAAPRRSRRS